VYSTGGTGYPEPKSGRCCNGKRPRSAYVATASRSIGEARRGGDRDLASRDCLDVKRRAGPHRASAPPPGGGWLERRARTKSAPGLAQDDAGSTNLLSGVPRRVLKTLLLPMLPLLSLQRNTLPIIRAGLQRDKDDYIKTIDKFALLEIHALMMLLDPSRKLRG